MRRFVDSEGREWRGGALVIGAVQVVNPSESQLTAAGYTVCEEEPTPVVSDDTEVWRLKALLAEGDYKVIKCMEAFLTGESLPYDIAVLHGERESLRARVSGLL